MLKTPSTIWRLITADLWKLLLLSTAVLVGVIAFAMTIGPLADGLLSPMDAIRFMFYASIPMLAYALPFAAGFAATLVYHRMAQDNELLASHAGGIGHAKLLAPAMCTGIVLSIVVGMMSDQIIPRFLRNMEQMITEDIARLMIHRLGQGETVEFGGNMIYADSVQRLDPTKIDAVNNAEDLIVLNRAVFARIGEDKRLESAGTSEKAFIVIYRDGDVERGAGSVVRLVAENYVGWGERYSAQSSDRLQYDFAVPGAFRDDPKYWSFRELRTLKNHPKDTPIVGDWHERLAYRTTAVEMMQDIHTQLQATGSCELPLTDGGRLTIHARTLGTLDWLKRPIYQPSDSPIIIERRSSNGSVSRYEAQSAFIEMDKVDENAVSVVTARIVLNEVTTSAESTGQSLDSAMTGDQPVPGRRQLQTIPGVLAINGLDETDTENETPSALELYKAMSVKELMQSTDYLGENVPPVIADAQHHVNRQLKKLQREIVSKTHMRLAMSAACLVMVLIGATVAIQLHDAMPLTVYLWAFFPALTAVLAISSGEQFAQQSGWPGLVVIWGSVAGLLVYAMVTYKKVCLR